MLRSWQPGFGALGWREKPRVEGDVSHGGPVRPVGPGGGGAARAKQDEQREENTKNLKPFRKKKEAHKMLLRGVRLPCSCSPLAFTQPVTKRSRVPPPGL